MLDEVMPAYDARGVHSVMVLSNAEQALDAVRRVTASEIRGLGLLWGVRVLPAMLLGRRVFRFDRHRPVWEAAARGGFTELANAPDGIVLAHIGQYWRPGGGERFAVTTLEAFRNFKTPGFAKAAIAIMVSPEEDGVRLVTETRVEATDPQSRPRLMRYWALIWPWSGLIRRGWLRAAKRRAEAFLRG